MEKEFCKSCEKYSETMGSCYTAYSLVSFYASNPLSKRKTLTKSEFLKSKCPYYLEHLMKSQNGELNE